MSIFVFLISPAVTSVSGVISAAGVEARLEVAEVHGLGGCPERPDRHRVGGRVAAQLRQAHVDRHLATLEAGRHLVRAGARLLALDPAAGVPPLAGAHAAADALAVLPRLRRLEAVEIELLGHVYASFPSTLTR